MIRFVLAEAGARYCGVDEGGIPGIVAASSTSCVVSLPREGRVQRYAYASWVKAGSIGLSGRASSVQPFCALRLPLSAADRVLGINCEATVPG